MALILRGVLIPVILRAEKLLEGTYHVSIRSYDGAGNFATLSDVGSVEIDTTEPEVSLVDPAAGNYSGSLRFRASASDSGSGVGSVTFGYKGSGDTRVQWLTRHRASESGGYWILQYDTMALLDGSYNISVRALDQSGNELEVENVVEIVIDNAKPIVSLIAPASGGFFSGDVLFNASSNDFWFRRYERRVWL